MQEYTFVALTVRKSVPSHSKLYLFSYWLYQFSTTCINSCSNSSSTPVPGLKPSDFTFIHILFSPEVVASALPRESSKRTITSSRRASRTARPMGFELKSSRAFSNVSDDVG